MGGVQRKWDRAERYGRKGRTVGGVHDMTAEERAAMFSNLRDEREREDERNARIERIKARRGNAA
jgi:hypothetical protein